jgi:hypothetical protein
MKFVKKLELQVLVKDNPFLKEQVSYLNRHCNFLTNDCAWDVERAELAELIDSDEFVITLYPVIGKHDELFSIDKEIMYKVCLQFNGTFMFGLLCENEEPYVLLSPLEAFKFAFPETLNEPDDNIDLILDMVFGLRSDVHVKYKIIN